MNSVKLRKEGAVSIQRKKPWSTITHNSSSDLPYLCYDQTRIAEATNAGKAARVPAALTRLPHPLLAVGVSSDSSVAVGIISSSNLFIWMKKDHNLRIVSLPTPLKSTYLDNRRVKHCYSGQSLAVNNTGTAVVLVTPDEQVWLWRVYSSKSFTKHNTKSQGTWQLLTTGASNIHIAIANDEMSAPSVNSSYVSSQSSSSESYCEPDTACAVDYAFSSSPDDGKFVSILRVWLRPVNESLTFFDYDFIQVTLEQSERGGQKLCKDGKIKHLRCRGKLDFWSREEAVIMLSLDHSGYLAAVAVNSSHLFMCQLIFLAPNEQRVTSRRLAQYITKDDMPPCNDDGHTDMWVQGIAWTNDDFYVVLALRSNCICIFTRLGEPVLSQIEMTSSLSEPRIFSHLFFSTEPGRFNKYPRKIGCAFKDSKLLVWDGFTVNFLEVLSLRTLRELAPMYLPHEQEPSADLSINISHETNPLPSEMDMGPKRHSIDRALLLLRSSMNLRTNQHEAVVFEAATAWLEAVLPPALHEEINYTINQSQIEFSESRINSNLVLKRKVRSCDVLKQFEQVLEILCWKAIPAVEYKEWTIMVAENVIKYLLADGQVFYAYNAIARAEKALGLKLHKLRMLVVAHALLQYKNCQANQLNVLFFSLAFVTLHGRHPSPQPLLNSRECKFLRRALRETLEIAPPDTEPEELPMQESFELPITPELHFIKPVREYVENAFKYLLERSCTFESFGERLCQLLISQDSQVDNLISTESLFIVAFYLDPLVDKFLSPVEFVSLELHKCISVQELNAKLHKLSTVTVAKSKDTAKEAAFLYWTIGLSERVVDLIEPNLAFAALVSALQEATESESRIICKCLRDLQPKITPLMAFEIVPEYIKVLFQVGELVRLKRKLKLVIEGVASSGKPTTLDEYVSVAARALKGTYLGTKKLSSKNWIYIEAPTTDDSKTIHAVLIKEAQAVIRYLWYLYIQDQLSRSTRKLPWLLRLIEFTDIQQKASLYSRVLNALWDFEVSDLELIAIYFMESELPRQLDIRLSKWKTVMSQRIPSLFAQAVHAMKQKQSFSVDFGFLDFCESVYRAYRPKREWAAVKQWREIEDRYRGSYKIDSRLMLSDGSFVPLEAESWDFTYLFRECKASEQQTPLEDEAEVTRNVCVPGTIASALRYKPKHPATARLKSPPRNFEFTPAPSFSIKLSCERLTNVLTAFLKRTVSRLYIKKKQTLQPKPGHRRQMSTPVDNSPYQIVSVKPRKMSTDRIKTSKQLNVEFTSVKVKHRRTKSAVERSERPFQLLRIKSKAC